MRRSKGKRPLCSPSRPAISTWVFICSRIRRNLSNCLKRRADSTGYRCYIASLINNLFYSPSHIQIIDELYTSVMKVNIICLVFPDVIWNTFTRIGQTDFNFRGGIGCDRLNISGDVPLYYDISENVEWDLSGARRRKSSEIQDSPAHVPLCDNPGRK